MWWLVVVIGFVGVVCVVGAGGIIVGLNTILVNFLVALLLRVSFIVVINEDHQMCLSKQRER